MRFGVREICDVVFKPLSAVDIGNKHFDVGQPVLYIDTAKTSTLEGASTTVYAQGGKGNPRLIGWDGEKTLTFTVEDALMSPISFAMLSGAGIIEGTGEIADEDAEKIYVHSYYDLVVEKEGEDYVAKLSSEVRDNATLVVSRETPIYPVLLDSAGAATAYLSAITEDQVLVDGEKAETNGAGIVTNADNQTITFKLATDAEYGDTRLDEILKNSVGQAVRVDCYTVHTTGATELQIDATNFAGYYYIEASTLFRDEATGEDMAAEFIIPRGKIQSNFTFTMANSGDPSTFTFTIDAFPAYTKFNKSKKVMAVLQIIDTAAEGHPYEDKNVLGHGVSDEAPTRKSNDDVNEWYTESIFGDAKAGDAGFNPGPGSEPEEPEEPEVTVSITAQIPRQVSLGSYNADEGFSGSIEQQGDSFKVTGDFTSMKGKDSDLAFPSGEDTGYYLPIEFTGTQGTALKRTSNGKITVVGSDPEDGDDKAIVIFYVDDSLEKEKRIINMVEYTNLVNANSNIDGIPFTIDYSDCKFK